MGEKATRHDVSLVQGGRYRMPSKKKMLMATIGVAVLLVLLELSMLNQNSVRQTEILNLEIEEGADFYPDRFLESEWGNDVDAADSIHLSLLHEACRRWTDSVVTWEHGRDGVVSNTSRGIINQDDVQLLEKMRQCPDVDISLPLGIRSHGYCEDSAAYTKYLKSRMLPEWAVKMKYVDNATNETFSYYDLCPKTPMIFFNHYWDGALGSPDWPAKKPVYLMPNIEMYELKAEHYWAVDVVICKTAICARYVQLWYQQEGNPRHTKVLYTRHVTSDVALMARKRLGKDSIKPKNWSDVHFIHTVGASTQKGTSAVLDCWISRPDFPHLDLYVEENFYNTWLKARYENKTRDSQVVSIHRGLIPADEFGKLIAESTFFMCPSGMEGYGHYINQARASGGVIVSTNMPPMNELLTSESGVLIPVKRRAHKQQILGGMYEGEHGLKNVDGFASSVKGPGVCQAVEKVLAMTLAERATMAARARKQYVVDWKIFTEKMKELQEFARGVGAPRFRSVDSA